MMPSHKGVFELSELPAVTRTLRHLALKAKRSATEKELLATLQEVVYRLQTDPLGWGDPEYHPRKEGSTVCHATIGSLFIQYAVFEPQKRVVMLKVIPMSSSPSSGDEE